MIIFTKDKSCIINSEFIMKACICNGNSIKADLTNNRMEMLAKYQNTKQCEIALDMLAHAMRNGDDVFEMPNGISSREQLIACAKKLTSIIENVPDEYIDSMLEFDDLLEDFEP